MDNTADAARRHFTPQFKLKVVLESMQRDTTIVSSSRFLQHLVSFQRSWHEASSVSRWAHLEC